MADAKLKTPAYEVRHVDGVMHLVTAPQKSAPLTPEALRVLPAIEEDAE